jgi:16S rRNA (cytidine1402-2'-O)-methyltransferase
MLMTKSNFGLYLVPSPLHEEGFSFLPEGSWETIAHVSLFIVENARAARRGLRKMGYLADFNTLQMMEWNENSTIDDQTAILDALQHQKLAVLMSDAGLPCIADPGYAVVMRAHDLGIPVFPWVGPSSILLTLMASGLNGQQFRFHGYLPREKSERLRAIKEIERQARAGETQLFMDTPYRNQSVLQDLLNVFHAETMICIGRELHSPKQSILTKSSREWKKCVVQIQKIPVMFAVGIKK